MKRKEKSKKKKSKDKSENKPQRRHSCQQSKEEGVGNTLEQPKAEEVCQKLYALDMEPD